MNQLFDENLKDFSEPPQNLRQKFIWFRKLKLKNEPVFKEVEVIQLYKRPKIPKIELTFE